jgi:hypothetical protein
MQTLSDSFGFFLDVIVLHMTDEYPQVAGASKAALEGISKSKQLPRSVITLVKENLYRILTALPRLVRSSNEHETLTSLKLICGCIFRKLELLIP